MSLALAGLVAVRILFAVLLLMQIGPGYANDYTLRAHQIAESQGEAYVDREVEYAPLELLFVETNEGLTQEEIGTRLIVVALLADIVAAIGLSYGWGRRASVAYLLLGTPLWSFLYLRFDLVPVAMVAWGLALAKRGRERRGGVLVAAATLARVWPVVILPGLWIGSRHRAFVWATGVSIAGVIVWITFTSVDAPMQVLTFRGASGWEVESPIGTAVWISTGDHPSLEAGAPRVGVMPAWSRLLLSAALAASLAIVWARARHSDLDPFGVPSLAALGALLTFSPIFSLQYAAWLIPFGAIAAVTPKGRASAALAAGITLATGLIAQISLLGATGLVQAALITRALLVVALVVRGVRGEARDRTAGENPRATR